jgi:rRNA-processing protein FCF1
MEIIVNEWLLEYLRPDAQESNRVAAIQFLNAFVKKGDKIVIKRNSRFIEKFHDYSKRSEQFVNLKPLFSMLHLLFRDSDKTVIVYDDELLELPDDIATKTPADDVYLIELWYSNQERIVLTTDAKLKERLKDVPNLKICLLGEFLQQYLA